MNMSYTNRAISLHTTLCNFTCHNSFSSLLLLKQLAEESLLELARPDGIGGFKALLDGSLYAFTFYGCLERSSGGIAQISHLHPFLAPFKAAILPLSKKEVLTGPAMELYNELSGEFMVDYDETGSIGKRYRREDEIGTPYCITFDFETVGDENTPADHCVTIRERDSMQQVRIPVSEVKAWLTERVKL